jgi:hypothetical protein
MGLRPILFNPCSAPGYAGANTPNFLLAAPDKAACAPFFKERRMKFVEPIERDRKFEAMGHPSRGRADVQN